MVFRPALDPLCDTPLYRQLSSYFARLIASGDIVGGERLPATRELAGLLGINRTTVSAAYEILESEGLITGQVGRGSFVLGSAGPAKLDWTRVLRSPAVDTRAAYAAPAAISFAASRPPEDLFPIEDFRESCREVLESERLDSILQLGSAAGYEPLRQHLLEESRREGVLGREDDLLITNGCQQALDLLRRVLVRPGTRVAVEDPVYPGLKNVLLEGGAELTGIPVGSSGIDWGDLRQARPAIAVVTPNFHNPTGLSFSLEDRQAVLRVARQSGTMLIENDIYSALRYHGEALPSLKQLSPDASTVLLRSYSKVAFPGLRLGWVIGPGPLIAAMREAKQLSDLHSDQFSQAVMLRFVQSGRLSAHVAKMVEAGRERLGIAVECLERALPEGSRWTHPEGGFNLWITLPSELDAARLLDRAHQAGVSYVAGRVFGVSRSWNNALRLSFGGARPDRIRTGIGILGRIFAREREERPWSERAPAPALV